MIVEKKPNHTSIVLKFETRKEVIDFWINWYKLHHSYEPSDAVQVYLSDAYEKEKMAWQSIIALFPNVDEFMNAMTLRYASEFGTTNKDRHGYALSERMSRLRSIYLRFRGAIRSDETIESDYT